MEKENKLESLDNVGNANILFLDISSTCTGYSVAECDFVNRKATITKAGALWFKKDMKGGDKYNYLARCITEYFYIMGLCDFLVHEAYAINMNQRSGIMVTPEMIGAVKAACSDLGVDYMHISPQTWRMHLGVKPTITINKEGKKKREYKQPTIDIIDTMTNIPNEIFSNVTKKLRSTPNDLYDAIGVSYGWLHEIKLFNSIKISKNMDINTHVSFEV